MAIGRLSKHSEYPIKIHASDREHYEDTINYLRQIPSEERAVEGGLLFKLDSSGEQIVKVDTREKSVLLTKGVHPKIREYLEELLGAAEWYEKETEYGAIHFPRRKDIWIVVEKDSGKGLTRITCLNSKTGKIYAEEVTRGTES